MFGQFGSKSRPCEGRPRRGRRSLIGWAAALWAVLAIACSDRSAPEYVADHFVDAYFRRFDQQAAREFTALGATVMLDRELELTKQVRETGYTQEQAAAEVVYRRRGRSTRGERVRFDYDVEIKHEDNDEHRAADVELAKIKDGWKVVRLEVRAQ